MDELLKKIGEPYKMFFDDGNYCGCFEPLYFLYPNHAHFPLPSENHRKNYVYGMRLLRQFCDEIPKNELRAGDIIATLYKGELHVGIFYEFNKLIHVFKGHSLQIGRLSLFDNYKCFRVVR